jgi:hypothetical protein
MRWFASELSASVRVGPMRSSRLARGHSVAFAFLVLFMERSVVEKGAHIAAA